jgi:hypothetical protein
VETQFPESGDVHQAMEPSFRITYTYVPTRRKKKGKKVIHGVIIREVNMRMNCDNLSIPRNSQSCVARKRRMAW